jgi:DNA adenine methylase
VLSNSDTPFIRELYKGFRVDTVYARRAINARADRRGPVTEVLVSSKG